jgi:hypothetical protein
MAREFPFRGAPARRRARPCFLWMALVPALTSIGAARAQVGPTGQAAATELDHQLMMEKLGIPKLRPAPVAGERAPNHANYDEARANPYPDWPDPLMTRRGRRITTAEMWWRVRRPEIVEDFEREVYASPVRLPQGRSQTSKESVR